LGVTTAHETLLTTQLAGMTLQNPVILAAGTAGLLDEMQDVLDLSRVGGVTTKSITRLPREGNATWRIIEHRAGMLNAIGLANPGFEEYEKHVLPRAARVPAAVIGSVAGFSIDDYVVVAAMFDDWHDRGIKAVEINVSCPNVQTGTEFEHSPALLGELLRAVRPVVKRVPLILKLSPTSREVVALARTAVSEAHRVDAITISNTIPGMAVNVKSRQPRLANVTGGFSGPGLHPVSVRLVHEVYRKVAKDAGVPLIGAGGVMTWRDAAEFILVGARAVQMGTALFADPRSPLGVVKGLAKWVRSQGCSNIGELVGAVRV
jgi:dihydroorotate dehydrogenase (NAD+) catalytic subunit